MCTISSQIKSFNKLKTWTFILFLIILLPIYTIASEEFRIVKLSGKDSTAVIKSSENRLRIIKVDDIVDAYGKVTEIASNRIVFESQGKLGTETIIIKIIDGKQRIERIRKTDPNDVGPTFFPAQQSIAIESAVE